jgi:hypothetical protein
MRYLFILLSLLFSSDLLNGQRSEALSKDRKYEIGLNVTRVLSNLVGNDAEEATFPITLKIKGKSNYWRIAIDPIFTSSNNLNLNARVTDITARLGIEKRVYFAERWRFFYGVDVYGFYKNDKSTNTTPIDVLAFRIQDIGGGVSPFFGFQFLISDRVALEIETSYLIKYLKTTSTLKHDVATSFDTETSANELVLSRPDPKFLYIIMRF